MTLYNHRGPLKMALLAGALLAGGSLCSQAATANWLSNSGDSYTNKTAWSTGLVPGSADTAVIGNATQPNGVCVYTNAAPDPAATNNLSVLQIGSTAGGTSALTMNAGTLSITNTGGNAMVVANANATGSFTMNGGVLNLFRNASTFFQDFLIIGNGPNTSPWSASGTFTLNNGTVNCIAGIEIGNAGSGTLNINGGTFIDNGWFGVGRGATSTNSQAFVNITGGTVYLLRNPGNEGMANGIAFNQGSTNAVFTMSGGTVYAYGFRFSQSGVAARTDTATVNISGGDLYLSGVGVLSQGATGTHINTINLSGGTFHTQNLGPNTGGTGGLTTILAGGTNWSWSSTLTANLNTSPGPGVVNFAPDAGRTITLNNTFNGTGGLTLAGLGTVAMNGTDNSSGATLLTGGTLSGVGTFSGSVTASAGTTIAPGTSATAGTLTLGNSLSLSGNTNIIKLSSDPTTVGSAVNDLIAVSGNVTLTDPVTIKVVPLGVLNTASPYTVLTYSGTTLTAGDAAKIHVISGSPRYNFTVIDPSTTPGSIKIQIGGNAANLVWKGGVAANPIIWDNATTNWLNLGTSALDTFFSGDSVAFNDSPTTNLVNITGTQQPAVISLANSTTAYTWIGGGSIAGPLDMEATAGLTLAMSNAPAFTGITNNTGPLVFNLQGIASYAVAAPISDNGGAQGTIAKGGTNTMVLQGNNATYTGTIIVTNGVLQYTNASGLGAAPSPLYATNGGTLDLNNVYPALKNIIIAGNGFNGQGALTSSTGGGLVNNNGVPNITMAGDASIGAASRWDSYQSMFNGNGFKLTEVGPGSNILQDDGETSLGDIHIVAGRLGFQGVLTMGDPNKLCVVESNATLTFFATTNSGTGNNGQAKVLVMNGFASFDSGGASNNFNGPVFLSGTNIIGTRSTLHLFGNIADTNGAGGILLGNDSVGASAGDLYLDGANSYSGATIVTNRTLFVGASSSLGSSTPILVVTPGKVDVSALASLQIASGRTLIGSGSVTGNVVVANGGTLIDGLGGNSTAAITLSGGLTLQSGSTNNVVVNKTASIANSKVTGLSSVTIGGTLVLNLLGNPLVAGDAIPLFISSGGYSGNFATIVPAAPPGAGLTWDTSTLASDGTLRVLSIGPATNPTNIVASASNNQLTLSWPSDHKGWTLQAQTNGLSTNWFPVTGSSTTNQMIIPIDPANTDVFYRMILNP